jgi:hypothetical protein
MCLSAEIEACIPGVMRCILGISAIMVLSTGCDLRALRQDELVGVRDAALSQDARADISVGSAVDAGAQMSDGGGGDTATVSDAGGGDTATVSDGGAGETDTGGDGGGGGDADARARDSEEGGTGCPAKPCEAFEVCDLSAMTCSPRTGTGRLSGSVTDKCTGRGIAARVGIAGRRQCSYDGKGSYYFDNLPEGDLALVAFKQGYKHFEIAVSIVATGNIQNIVLEPDTADTADGGCGRPPVADVACTCQLPGCP